MHLEKESAEEPGNVGLLQGPAMVLTSEVISVGSM